MTFLLEYAVSKMGGVSNLPMEVAVKGMVAMNARFGMKDSLAPISDASVERSNFVARLLMVLVI
jgi:hypothetical protein